MIRHNGSNNSDNRDIRDTRNCMGSLKKVRRDMERPDKKEAGLRR